MGRTTKVERTSIQARVNTQVRFNEWNDVECYCSWGWVIEQVLFLAKSSGIRDRVIEGRILCRFCFWMRVCCY